MAYILNSTDSSQLTANTSFTLAVGVHQAGDQLWSFAVQDVGSGTLTPPAGWEAVGVQAAGGGVRSLWAWKNATSSSETCTWSSTLSDEWSGSVVVVRDAQSAPFGATPTSGIDFIRQDTTVSAVMLNSGVLTPAVDGCLLLYGYGLDVTRYGKIDLNDAIGVSKQNTATVSHVVGSRQQEAAATTSALGCRASQSSTGQCWMIAIRNASGGALNPEIRSNVTQVRFYGDFGAAHDATTTWQSPSNFAATINGISCSTVINNVNGAYTEETWGQWTQLYSLESTAGIWSGGTHTIASTNMDGKLFAVSWARTHDQTSALQGVEGVLVGFSDGTNWAVYQVVNAARKWSLGAAYTAFIACGAGNATPYASSGTLDWTAITRVGYFWHRQGSAGTSHGLYVKNAALIGNTAITGGGANRPATFVDYMAAMGSWGSWKWAELQGSAQVLAKSSVQIGDGANSAYFDSSASSLEFPPDWSATYVPNKWQMLWNIAAENFVTLGIKLKATDTIKLAASVAAADPAHKQALTIDAATSTSASYDFGGQSFVGLNPTWLTGVACANATFSRCGEIAGAGANFTNCTIKATASTDAALSITANSSTLDGVTIDVSGTSAAYHLELGASVTAITLTDVAFTGTPTTDKVHVLATSGTVTITTSGTTTLVAGDVTSAGATVVISAPTLERGLYFTGLVAGSKVKVFTTGTDTELFSTASSGTTETWDDATAGSITVDYVVMKAGYLPIRVTGVVCTGAVGTGVVTTPISQAAARWYQASSGLTIGTNCFANAATKLFGLTTATTGQNLASYLLEQWIALGDTSEAYANKPFPIEANGPNSFSWLDGWEADLTTYPNTITNLSRDGMRYLDSSGTQTAVWAALLSVGVSAGMQVRYQQSDGGTTVNANATGNIDQLIQVYGDATHGNFDRRSYLICKVQEQGYDQAEVDVVAQYGNLEDQLYVIGLNPLANGVATGDPGISGVTITDHGASPVTWNSKAFSITITDSGTNSGTDIMRWLRYNFDVGGTFQGKDGFNWHDLMQVNGDKFKGVRGAIYGDTGATLKGVRVLRGTDAHPDVTLHTADDGTTVSTTPPAQATATILANSRIQLYNVTTASELDNSFQTGTSYANTLTGGVSIGDTLRLRVCKLGYDETQAFAVWTATGCAFIISQSASSVYTAWGIDGSTVTEFAPDTTGHIYVESNDPDGASTKARLGAYYSHLLTTEGGIRYYYGAITYLSTAAIRVNTAVVDLLIENVNATTALRFTDTDVRLYRDDGTTIIAPTSYSIHNDYSGVPDVVETGVSGLTGAESAQLMGLPSASATASATLAAAQVTPIHSDIRKVNSYTVDGTGQSGNEWGPV